MSTCSHIVLMASYNEWMNAKLYECAGKLSAQELAADRGVFFRSIIGTLNHIVVGDTTWLPRFAMHPARHGSLDPVRQMPLPTSLDQIMFADLGALATHRRLLDQIIRHWAGELTEADLHHILHYKNLQGIAAKKRFSSLVMHFFNHQTHHRGHATAMLHQAGQDVGVTDLLALIPSENDA